MLAVLLDAMGPMIELVRVPFATELIVLDALMTPLDVRLLLILAVDELESACILALYTSSNTEVMSLGPGAPPSVTKVRLSISGITVTTHQVTLRISPLNHCSPLTGDVITLPNVARKS